MSLNDYNRLSKPNQEAIKAISKYLFKPLRWDRDNICLKVQTQIDERFESYLVGVKLVA